MTEILSAVSPSVFSWSMLGRRSLAAFLLPRPEKGVWWPAPCRIHPVRVAAVALKLTDLVSISRNAATVRATWSHLSSSPIAEQQWWDFSRHSWSLEWCSVGCVASLCRASVPLLDPSKLQCCKFTILWFHLIFPSVICSRFIAKLVF